MRNEQNPVDTPVGLYKDPESGMEIGALHEAQAAAFVRAGYKLVSNDPMKTQEAMDADNAKTSKKGTK